MNQANRLCDVQLLQSSSRANMRCSSFAGSAFCYARVVANLRKVRNLNGRLAIFTRAAVTSMVLTLYVSSGSAQTAKDVKGATPLVAIQDEPPAQLIVDPPIPEQLVLGRVFIQYRTENLRILPVFGKAALAVSPRVGHLHYYLDDQSWPTVDTSGETVVFVGLPPGPHKVRLELADATHRPIPGASKVVEFIVPAKK